MIYKIKDRDVDIIFDGQCYIGTYDCIQIKRQYKQDVIYWFTKRFNKI